MNPHDREVPRREPSHAQPRVRTHRSGRGKRQRSSGLVFGLVLLTAGALFLLDNLGVLDVEPYLEWWPLVLIVIGLTELFGGSRVGALVWMAFGGWFLLYNFDLLVVNPFEVFWPVLFIVVGSIFIWQSFVQKAPTADASRMSAYAFMAGNVQRGFTGPIDRVQTAAVMGGCEVDLRMMTRGESESIIDCFAMWGGIEIAIPEGWAFENRITPILAGVEDKTAPPAPDAPKVVLTGTVIMGGVEVRN